MTISLQEKDNLTRWQGKLKPHHESYNVKLIEGKRAMEWVYSVTQLKHSPGNGNLHAITYHNGHEVDVSHHHQTFPLDQIYVDRQIFFFQLGENSIYNTGLRGTLPQGNVSWDLNFQNSIETFNYIPFPFMKVLKSFPMKRCLPNTNLNIQGSITHGNEHWDIQKGWGQQNHMWGTSFPNQSLTFICPLFAEDPETLVMGWRTSVLFRGKPLMALYIKTRKQIYRFPALFSTVHCPQGVSPYHFTFEATRFKKKFVGQISVDPAKTVTLEDKDPSGRDMKQIRTMLASLQFMTYEKKKGRWDLIRSLNAHEACSFTLGVKEGHPLFRQL